MSTRQLYAEVRVNIARTKPVDTPNEAKALTTELQQAIQALTTRFEGFQQRKGNRHRNQGEFGGKSGGKHEGNGERGGRRSRRCGKSKLPYHSDRYCKQHDIRGHSTEECRLAKKE